MYSINAVGIIVPFLYAARLMVENYGSLSVIANKRKAPLLRKKDAPERYEG
ncbi:MAG: hypothetical protein HFH93_05875 [Lachnospiraceae bacterium]|nr:hypothetical protein [Lachnospiraceae bacterium]